MLEISQEELDELRTAKIRADIADAQAATAAAAGPAEDAPPEPTHFALLADGSRYEYSGAHPTQVGVDGKLVPVLSVHPL
jgi:hypothetical protein